MIGTSDGLQFNSEIDHMMANSPLRMARDLQPKDDLKSPTEGPSEPQRSSPMRPKGGTPMDLHRIDPKERLLDRDHHVPLVASALIDSNGDMYGMAIDHRIPENKKYENHLWDHEAFEAEYMKHLMKIGYNAQDSYHKAHDWSTQRESAAVEAEFGADGLDAYKQHWRDAASMVKEPTDRPRHPDAHTTQYGLDESETGQSFPRREALFRGLKGAAQIMSDAVPPVLPQPSYNPASPAARGTYRRGMWFQGAEGKWRQEIPDENSKLNLQYFDKRIDEPEGKPSWTSVGTKEGNEPVYSVSKYDDGHLTLGHIFDHPELYKSYPELKDVKIHPLSEEEGGGAHAETDTKDNIWLATRSAEQLHSSLLHEIQHIIQAKEGFTLGASPEMMKPYVAEAITRSPHYEEILNQPTDKFVSDIDEASKQFYRDVAGEVEARNVQRRFKHPLAAKMFHPRLTEDTFRKKKLNSPMKDEDN